MLTVCRSTVEVARQFHPAGGRFLTRPYTKNGEHRRMKVGRPLVEKISKHVAEHGMQPGDLIFPVRLFMPETAWVNMPRCTPEEMTAARGSSFISPVTGNRVSHGVTSTYRKHLCRCGPCVQNYRDERSARRVRTMARRGKLTQQRVRRDQNDFISASEWSRIWIPARKAARVDITPYQLRHSHASLLLAHGVPLADVQARLGHNDLSSTTHYVWALAEDTDTAANAMNVILGCQDKPASPQDEMMAKMTAMMERMEAMMDPVLAGKMAAEQVAPRQGLHLVADTLDAIGVRERSAAWEPLETVLTAAGLPPSWDWQFARLDKPGQATTGQYGHVFLLLADPPLVLHVRIEEDLAGIGIDPAFAVGVAEGIRQTARANPGVAAALLTEDGTPLLCELRLEAHRPPDTPEDSVRCRLAAASGPPPVIELVFGADWLEHLAEDPVGGHAVLGRALADGLRHALGLPSPAAEAFLDHWSQAVPVAAPRTRETTLPPSFQGRDRLPRTAATAARARRAIAAGIIASEVPLRAIYAGEAAVGLCTEVILPAADKALADAIVGWSPDALPGVARCLNDAHADRVRRATELSLALTAPWGPHWQETALDAPEPATITRPLELLLETLLARPAAGGISPDTFDIAEAADLASEAIDASLALHATRHRLHDLQIAVGEHGQYIITDTAPQHAATATIDIGAYLQADRADRLRLNPQPLTGTPVRLTGSHGSQPQDFTRLEDLPLPGSLRAADTAMKQAMGTGIDGIHTVLGTAVTWTTGADDVSEAAQAELREAATAWSHLPPEQIDAALDLLILTPGQLRDEGLPYWEQERRTHRLATRPLISTQSGRLLLIPRRIEATMDIYAAYFLDGRLPWPPDAVPRPVADAFGNFRNRQNRELERHVLQILEDAEIPFTGNIEPHHAAPSGLRLTGEVDALAGDPARSRLWVCEVKDVSATASPRTLANRVRKFTDPRRGYISQLLRTLAEVRASPGAAARLLGLPDPDRAWTVLPLMITRRVEPAAFTSNPAVIFVVCEDLAAVLQAPADPPPGQAS